MLVIAKQLGYYDNKRRREGEEFLLEEVSYKDSLGNKCILTVEEQFSQKWMEKVESDFPKKKAKEQKPDDIINSIPGYTRAGAGRKAKAPAKELTQDE
jgi:hypothetical protein